MSKLVGISGPQGSGKSTVLNEIKKNIDTFNLNWAVDDFKVSRTVQEALGWETLSKVQDSPETMMEFQAEVFKQKYDRDLMLTKGITRAIIFTERTFADLSAYALLWTYKFVDSGLWEKKAGAAFYADYNFNCLAAHRSLYCCTVLIPFMDCVKFEDDPRRAEEKDINFVFNHINDFLTSKLAAHEVITITEQTPENRAKQIQNYIKEFYVT
jgi:hypothetical protein